MLYIPLAHSDHLMKVCDSELPPAISSRSLSLPSLFSDNLGITDIVLPRLNRLLIDKLLPLMLRLASLSSIKQLLLLSDLRTRPDTSRLLTTVHLPFHEFAECALWLVSELRVWSYFGYFAVRSDANDHVGALDRRQSVRDANGRVVACEEPAKGLVHERLGLRVEGGRRFVENQDVGVLQ